MSSPNAAVALLSHNAVRPDKMVFICGNDALSYRDLEKRSRSFAYYLTEEGIRPGDRVLIVLPDSFGFPIAFLGCLLCGAIAVAAGYHLSDEDLSYIIDDCNPQIVVTDARIACRLNEDVIKTVVCHDGHIQMTGTSSRLCSYYDPADHDIAYMLYTSGSTGHPKGVPHRHKSLMVPCELMGERVLGLTERDVIFSSSKLSFAYGLINSLAFPLSFGATAILHQGKPDPATILDILARHKPSVFFSVPEMYTRIIISCTEPEIKVPMRLCCSAGEHLPEAVFQAWHGLTGKEIIDGIGSTETSYHFICNLPGEALAGSSGRLVPGYRARLVDDQGQDVPPGSQGNLLISGETCSPNYWNHGSGKTMGSDGFIRTGDIFVEKNGFYYYRGRSDDLIKCGAHWISPLRVEEALRSHPAIADCAIAAVSVGTLVKPGAFIVCRHGIERSHSLARELREHVLNLLPEYMCPVRFQFLEELPRTSTGKVQRYKLRELSA